MKDEENKTGISMDMGGAIEPVVLPPEEEEVKVEVPEVKSTEIPQLMQIGNDNTEVPPIMEGLVETETPKEEVKVEEKPKPVPVPTIGPIPAPAPAPTVEAPKVETPAPTAPNLEQIKNEAKAEALAAAKPKSVPVPTIGPLPTQPATPPEVKVETPVVTEAPTVEVPVATVPEVPVAPAQPVQPAPAPTPTVPAVPVAPAPIVQEVPVAQVVAPEVATVAVPETPVPATPEVPTVATPEGQTVTIPVAQEPIAEQVVVPTEPTDDLDKTMVIPAPVEGTTEEVNEEGPAVIKGPNVIEAPVATENKEKEKKKNPYFLECPPNCIPIKPLGYIGYTILYAIPIIGLIFILAHSASIKNYNRRNFARSHLIVIVLIILAIVALVYLFDFDIIGFIENLTGYKIDIQHFKFTKFK